MSFAHLYLCVPHSHSKCKPRPDIIRKIKGAMNIFISTNFAPTCITILETLQSKATIKFFIPFFGLLSPDTEIGSSCDSVAKDFATPCPKKSRRRRQLFRPHTASPFSSPPRSRDLSSFVMLCPINYSACLAEKLRAASELKISFLYDHLFFPHHFF